MLSAVPAKPPIKTPTRTEAMALKAKVAVQTRRVLIERVIGRVAVRTGGKDVPAHLRPVQKERKDQDDPDPDGDDRREWQTKGPRDRLGNGGHHRRGVPVGKATVLHFDYADGDRAHRQSDYERVHPEPVTDIASEPTEDTGAEYGKYQRCGKRNVIVEVERRYR